MLPLKVAILAAFSWGASSCPQDYGRIVENVQSTSEQTLLTIHPTACYFIAVICITTSDTE